MAQIIMGALPEYAKMTEAEFQAWIVKFALEHGWLVHHTPKVPDGYGSKSNSWWTPTFGHSGYPDLTLARGGRRVMSELKSEDGRKRFERGDRPEQERWLRASSGRGQEVFLWSPRDVGEIQRVLS